VTNAFILPPSVEDNACVVGSSRDCADSNDVAWTVEHSDGAARERVKVTE
jgi:hypothetical protein